MSSSWLLVILLALISVLATSTISVTAQCLNDQRSILLQLKNSLKFDSTTSTKLALWNQSTDCCLWIGVTCDFSGRVIGLDLSNESISDGITDSSSLFNLKYLERLNLGYNTFRSIQIPSRLGIISNLTYLNLSSSGFSGQIPIEISHLKRLVILDLSDPSFLISGLPSLQLRNTNLSVLVKNLTELEELYLDGVNISAQGHEWSGTLSKSLSKLQVLSLSACNLSGPIDPSLVRLNKSLSVIRLDQNNLSASVPEFLGNFLNLTSLSLTSCELRGKFPDNIFKLPTLRIINLGNNRFLQGILGEFPDNGSLQSIVLSITNFSGELPDSIGRLTNLSRIELKNCNFSGLIPASMGNLTQLEYFDLSANSFVGSIPSFTLAKNLTQLMLQHNHLNGTITSTDWGNLLNLQILYLHNNSFQGSVPLSLFKLPSVEKIQLSYNQFTGLSRGFPNVSSSRLDTLDLSSNRLNGSIPTYVFDLKELKILSLSSNNFSGSIKLNAIQKLVNLSLLDLSYNNLLIDANVTDSASFFSPQLSTLKLASSKLRNFPDFLNNQSKLTYLDLSQNEIHGKIPNWIWQLGNETLRYLNLSHNFFTDIEEFSGDISSSLSVIDLHSNKLHGQLPPLPQVATYLDYSSNNFTSVIPPDIGSKLTFAMFLSLSDNRLQGTIPNSICNVSTYLQVLDLSNNNLDGAIPSCVIEMSETLGVLNLRNNNLSEIIPDVFPGECELKTFDVNGNRIVGQMPKSLANCRVLEVLDIGNNMISDTFPCWLKNSSSLRVLVLRRNRFKGTVRCAGSNSNWHKLQIVDVSSNNFTGNLPTKSFYSWEAMKVDEDSVYAKLNHLQFQVLALSNIYYQDAVIVTSKGLDMEFQKILTVFTSIDFSGNKFQGEIPEELGSLKALYILNLSRNSFTGQIPSSIGNLRQLESLDFSLNNLSGKIPLGFTYLNFLSYLNLSSNQLVGKIPSSTQLQTFSNASFLGNKLCGPPLGNCSNSTGLSNSHMEFDGQFLLTGVGFGVGAGILVGLLMFWNKGRKWYNSVDERIDRLLLRILVMMRLLNIGRVKTEEAAEEDFTGEYDDMDQDDEMEEKEAMKCKFCVFCSKLDVSRTRAVHNPNCTCLISPTISSSSSSSSRSSSFSSPL